MRGGNGLVSDENESHGGVREARFQTRREMVRESVGEFADRRRKDERRRRRKKKRSSVADGESIAGFVESEREENSLGNRSRVRRRRRGLAQRQLPESGSFVCSRGV